MRLIPKDVKSKDTFKMQSFQPQNPKNHTCLLKINIVTLTTTLNKGFKAKILILSLTPLQCLNCNSLISQEKKIGIKLHRQSSRKWIN